MHFPPQWTLLNHFLSRSNPGVTYGKREQIYVCANDALVDSLQVGSGPLFPLQGVALLR
jgi:hypothetical protein